MLGIPRKHLGILYALLSINLAATALGDTCVSDYEKVADAGSYEMSFGSFYLSGEAIVPQGKAPVPGQISSLGSVAHLDLGSKAHPVALPVSAMEQVPGLMKAAHPELDLGTEPKYRFAHGGQATVLIPAEGRHVIRIVKNANTEKFRARQNTESAHVARLRQAGLDKRIALPLHEKYVEVRGQTFHVQTFEKYDGSLTDFYKTEAYKKLSYQEKTRLANELSETIRLMHAIGLYHFDLKSDNILYRLKPGGKIELAVADLGLMNDPSTMKRDEAMRGTPFYLSPTALGGQPRDARNDVYPLGVVFQELMTGHLVREAAKAEGSRSKSPVIPASASDSAIYGWLLAGGASTPFQYHSADGIRPIPNHTRVAFPYADEPATTLNPVDRAARENLAVLGWFPFRNANDMTAATAEAAKNPEGFRDWLLGRMFAEKPGVDSSYNWKSNGGHIMQSLLSNDVFARWVTAHADRIPPAARTKMLAELKLVHQAVLEAENPDGSGEGTAGSYRVRNKSGSPTGSHLRLYLTDKGLAYEAWFGRFVNGHALEKLIEHLEAVNRTTTAN